MSKYDIGVGEAFPLDESQPRNDACGHHGRHHCHDHDHQDDHHHGRHHHAHMVVLFALKAHRHRTCPPAEPQK